jgi:hypothetical protein
LHQRLANGTRIAYGASYVERQVNVTASFRSIALLALGGAESI